MDQEILNLKAEGKSLRQIGKALGISQEAVRKRLKKLSTKKVPAIDTDLSVNSSLVASGDAAIGTFDLAQAILRFLKERGLEIYRLKTESEAYQVKHDGQVIRFYVQSKG